MIDIHCHLLFGVDDGADSIEESVGMLEKAAKQGIDSIILTPHYRHGMFHYNNEKIEQNYKAILPYAQKLGLHIFPGTEYNVNSYMMEYYRKGRCHTLGDSRYILTEYTHGTEYSYIAQMTQEALRNGYIPIIAHAERYGCMVEKIQRAEELRDMGAWIQNNADAVLGLEGRGPKKYCKKLLKEGWTDVIASDSHGLNHRACNMAECRSYVARKFGEDYADILFHRNPGKIISEITAL